jgi:uncharacterized protein (TIGR02147 family)
MTSTENFEEVEMHEAGDYRSFLRLAIQSLKDKNSKFGYSELSRLSGLKSRSFPRDVVMGKKKLSLATAEAMSDALNLNDDLKSLFLLLIELEEPTFRQKKNSIAKISQKIKKTRNRIRELSKDTSTESKRNFYLKRDWVDVRASVSDIDSGSTLKQISERTGFLLSQCKQNLDELIEAGYVQYDSQKELYFADSQHMILHDLRDNEFFKSWYLDSARVALKKAEENFSEENLLFLNSVFLVRSDQLKQVKSELINVMLKFVDDAETSDGDKLARISLSFT